MNIFTKDGLNGLKNLLDKKDSILKLQNGQKIDITSCEIQKAPNLPENPPVLIPPNSESYFDAENAIELHKYFKKLSPRVACGPYLWVSLGFIYHQDYLLSRWPLKDDEPRAKINDRYFLKIGRYGYFRNAVSRLWWTAYMTHDENLEPAHAYDLTKLAFEYQEYQFQFMLRKYGSSADVCRRILRHFLVCKSVYQERAVATNNSYLEFIKLVGKRLNLYSSVYLLDLVDESKLNDFISREADVFFVQK